MSDDFYGYSPAAPGPAETQASVDGEPALSAILDRCGFNALSDKSPIEEIYAGLRAFAEQTSGRDAGWLALARGELVKKLEAIGIKGALSVVKAAFPREPKPRNAPSGQGKPVLFEDVEPWPEQVDGAELLAEISSILRQFVVMPEEARIATGLWIMHGWTLDAFQISPILRIESPAKGCGKSTLLMVVGELLLRNISTANITTAALFRLVDAYNVSLCIDETDMNFKENQDLIGLVNAGYLRRTAIVPRCDGDSHEVKLFSSWAPKVLAGIGRLTDTTESRCIRIKLERRLPSEKTEPFSLCETEIFGPIKEKLSRWSADNLDALAGANPDIPAGLGDRPSDNWRPLLAIADLAGGPWPERARAAALELSGTDAQDDDSTGVQLLRDISGYFEEHETDRVTSEELVKLLVEMEARPWGEWRHGKPLSKNGLARLLKKFGIGPKKIRFDNGTFQGYERGFFENAFTRYLATGTPEQALKNKELFYFQSGTREDNVPVVKSHNSFKNNECSSVPVGNTQNGEKKENLTLWEDEA